MRHLKTVASALIVVLVLVMATDYVAMATTGKTLLLGSVNTVTKATVIKKTTDGPALRIDNSTGTGIQFHTRAGKSPFKVNRTAKVKKLNADLLDGKNASELSSRILEFRSPTGAQPASTVFTLDLPAVDAGTYLATYSVWMDNPQPAPTTASPIVVQCYLALNDSGGTYVSSIGTTAMTTEGLPSPGLSGSGAVKIKQGQKLQLFCGKSPFAFTVLPDSPIQVTLVKMATSERTTVAARSSTKAPAATK